MKSILFVVALFLILIMSPSVQADDDTFVKIQEMVNDLGNKPSNNGQVLKCYDSGTKKITIRKTKSGTSYEGIYNKCTEFGRMRDGNIMITIGG